MEYFLFILGFILIWVGVLCAFWFSALLNLLMSYLLAPKFGQCLSAVSAFGINYIRGMNGNWTKSKGRFSLRIQHKCSIDISRKNNDDVNEKNWQFMGIKLLISAVLFLLITFLFFGSIRRFIYSFNSSPLDNFLTAFCLGLIISVTVSAVVTLRERLNVGRSLAWYIDTLTQRIRNGEPFSALELRPLNELPYKSGSGYENDFYNTLYMMYLISEGRYDEMKVPAYEMTSHMRMYTSASIYATGTLYMLVFYYSRYDCQPPLANEFLEKVRDKIGADNDANARRVLAYHAYCIEGDRQKARFFLDQAAAASDIFSTGAERDLEKRLIAELDEKLRSEGS